MAGYLEDSLAAARSAPRFRNAVGMCRHCGLTQQAFDDATSLLIERVYAQYQPTYSMSVTVQSYMASFLDRAITRSGLSAGDYVLEIGSNDNAVLAELHRRGHRPIGLDPCADPAEAAQHGYKVMRVFFSEAVGRRLRAEYGPVELVISRHTLEHVFNPLDFILGVAVLLAPSGLAVIEVPYLHRQLTNNQFQSMTFQHICFFTVSTMRALVRAAGMELVDVIFSEMDGGSMIAFLGHPGRAGHSRAAVDDILAFEEVWQLSTPDSLAGFFSGLDAQRTAVQRYLTDVAPRTVAAFGAGSKGQALLNMLSLERQQLPFVIDETPGAAGKFVPGVGTEVVPLSDARLDDVRILVITAPTHVAEVVRRAQTRFEPALPMLATAPALHFVAPAVI